MVPDMDSDNTIFRDSVDFLRDKLEFNLDIDWAAIDPDRKYRAAAVQFHFKKMNLSEVFYKMLHDSGLPQSEAVVGAEGNVIIVTSPADMEERILAIHQRRSAGVDPDGQRMLAESVPLLILQWQTLDQSISTLSRKTGIQITYAPDVLAAAGISFREPIKVLLKNTDLATALDVILAHATGDNVFLTYTADKTGVHVSIFHDVAPDTPEGMAARLLILADGYAELGCLPQAEKKYKVIVAKYAKFPEAKDAAAHQSRLRVDGGG
jgi:hypothetical protein